MERDLTVGSEKKAMLLFAATADFGNIFQPALQCGRHLGSGPLCFG